jgi:site-specific DNA-cytosine methylase
VSAEVFPTIIAGLSHRGGTTQDVYVFSLIKVLGQVRRITPPECEVLQGFPRDWTDQHSDTIRYHQIGNAVTVNVSSWIGSRL